MMQMDTRETVEGDDVETPPDLVDNDGDDRLAPRPAKRRKVRKGTRSCWECKRRKIRCIFESLDHDVCLGCERRRAPCVSQDLPEELAPEKKGNRHLGERIARVEELMKDLLASNEAGVAVAHASSIGGPEAEAEGLRQHRQHRLSGSDASTARSENSATPTDEAPLTYTESLGDAGTASSLEPDPHAVLTSDLPDTKTAREYLLAALPCQNDADYIIRESTRMPIYTQLAITQPHSRLTREELAEARCEVRLPPRDSHPVLLAKFMLMLALTLQSPRSKRLVGLSEPPDTIMRRLVAAATTWVTTKEEMQGTVESLVCVLLEGAFETNCGNLRRAWAVYRRAMTFAQMIDLQRPLKRLDPATDAKPQAMWFRIVYMDRYLSLLLGLPQLSSDTSMANPAVLQGEPPLGKFDRLLTLAACHILERNERPFTPDDLKTTQSIDSKLLGVSKGVPASFWRPVTFQGLVLGQPDTFLETLRLESQVYYFGLLIQLHLPHIVPADRSRDNMTPDNEYSKMTCVNASREVLARFIAHRSFNPASSCSRPVDFFALLAAMTLLVVHLDAQYRREAANVLAHQRLSDRAMLDQALECMESMRDANGDAVADDSAELVHRLLAIEADAAGVRDERASAGSRELRLRVPRLGVITVTRQGPSIAREEPRPHPRGDAPPQPYQPSAATANSPIPDSPEFRFPVPRRTNTDTNTNTISEQLCLADQLNEMVQCPMGHGYEQGVPEPSRDRPSAANSTLHASITVAQQAPARPDPAPAVDEWDLQGVETAFFTALLRGSSSASLGAAALGPQQRIEDPVELCPGWSCHVDSEGALLLDHISFIGF
ncbi:C6 zinc finger domain protein [Lasiosphaeria ovina]|uniref:C6 zinc finger domain protein n=1 Tax=Lasiosphaeria ovina TaxID=92902 RepID=A0AAE0JU86_9PEZI|nr:C6 zinc finger domain protein [Lasiosphaeria ovina]